MLKHRPADSARSRSRLRLPTLLAVSLFALLALAPSAFAWHGNLVVRKVNLGGPAQDTFNFTVSKSPNAYQDIWSPATKTFTLSGVPNAGDPFTEGTTQKTFSSLWAGYDSGYNAWVTYTVKEAAKAGYQTTIGCTIAGDWNSLINGAIPGSYGGWTYTPGTSNGDPKVDTSVRWYNNISYTTTCTFTNTYRSRIRVRKTFADPIADNASVTAAVSGTYGGSPVSTTKSISESDAPAANVTDWVTVDGGSAATVSESDGSVPVSKYTKTLTCDNGVTGTLKADGSSWAISSVPAGKDVTCTIDNVRKTAKVKVIKYTDPVQTGGFDLQVDGVTKQTDVGNAGTTGYVYVEPGTHSARETATGQDWVAAIPGYASKYLCEKNPASYATAQSVAADGTAGTASGDYQLAAGDKLVCVFLNTKETTLKVAKIWDVPAGTTQAVDLTINGDSQGTATAPTAFTSGGLSVAAGSTNAYGETTGGAPLDPAQWETTDLGCTNGDTPLNNAPGTVTVPAGADVTCTIENRRRSAHIEIVKHLVPDTDGGRFDLTLNDQVKAHGVGENGTTGTLTVPTGEYTVDEIGATVDDVTTDLNGYDSTVLCEPRAYDGEPAAADPGHSKTIVLSDGDDVVCTITNTRKATLKVAKIWEGPAGSTQKVDLTIDDSSQGTATAPAPFTTAGLPVAGGSEHTYGETTGGAPLDESQWETSDLGCTNGDAPLDNQAGSVVVPAGGDVTCTIVNRRRSGTLILRKQILPSTDTGTFVLKAGDNATAPLGNNGEQTFSGVPTGDYALSEGGAPGTDAGDYVLGAPVCTKPAPLDARSERAAVSDTVDVPVTDGKVSVGSGDEITCTWTNTRRGKVTIKKIAVDSTGKAVDGTFGFTGDLGPLSVVANGDGVTTSVVPNASYKETETVPAGYTLTKAECADGVGGDGQASSVSGATVTANVQPGETVVCTYTNTKNATPPGTESVGAAGGVSPTGASGGTVKRRGSAKLSGTVGCASATYASATVKGTQIRRVAFYVNGKKVKTLTKPNAGTAYRLQYATKGLKIGSYKVRAQVEFVAASGTKPKSLNIQFSRCKARSVSPKFTG